VDQHVQHFSEQMAGHYQIMLYKTILKEVKYAQITITLYINALYILIKNIFIACFY
jgi:poly-beta-hydroxyalkanoate depolymerase